MKFIPISWTQFEKDTIALAKNIRDEYGKIDEIIAIARGGIILSRILADILEAKISFITIESYKNLEQQKNPIITQLISKEFQGEKVLLVDDLADTGSTFIQAYEYLKKIPIKTIITASPYIKPHTKYIPHFYIKKLDGWVIFPYELRETKAALIEQFGLEKAKQLIKKLNITDWSKIS